MAASHIISADSHFVEPPNMWAERVDKKFRDRAPHTVRGLNGREGEFFVCENISPVPVAGFFGAGVPSEALAEHIKKGMDAAPASVWDPAARIKDQLMEDIGAGVQELQRIAKKGMRGAMIWAAPPEELPYNHTDYDPFWTAAQDLNMPLSLHILTGRKGTGVDFLKGNLALQVSTLHHEVERSIAVFVLGGVLERFPKLTIVSAENDVAWMPYFMWRMDFAQERVGSMSSKKLSLKPSEYVKRQIYASFINEPIFLDGLHRYAADNAMWSSDYPHTAAIWPKSQEFIKETFSGLAEADRRKIIHDTAARVYGITD
jgi:predicted TIM-barrel fold metal-dependent hydrolase